MNKITNEQLKTVKNMIYKDDWINMAFAIKANNSVDAKANTITILKEIAGTKEVNVNGMNINLIDIFTQKLEYAIAVVEVASPEKEIMEKV